MSVIDDLIESVHAKPTLVTARYTVTPAMTQIHGVLHGGISAAVAEHVASLGATAGAFDGYIAVGVSLEAHHLRPAPLGAMVDVQAWPESSGHTIQTWRVEQRLVTQNASSRDDAHALFNVCTVTLYLKKAPDHATSVPATPAHPTSSHATPQAHDQSQGDHDA
ncbi:MAG: hotdog domain-containing protein [Actinomycetaceae bacterium]|nr:hotdog domain-containing protein [Actinomycetaceae bacterium]MDY6082752.1 hotdog domain-containing protein [Actinomycetaceae bacterium]